MCVYIEPNAKTHDRVIGYKIFRKAGRRLIGLVFTPNGDDYGLRREPYEIGKVYQSSRGPGFQAFTSHRDAEQALLDWKRGKNSFAIKEVLLEQVQLGVNAMMGANADGKLGWIAKQMTILAK